MRRKYLVAALAAATAGVLLAWTGGAFAGSEPPGRLNLPAGASMDITCPNGLTNTDLHRGSETVRCGVTPAASTTSPSTTAQPAAAAAPAPTTTARTRQCTSGASGSLGPYSGAAISNSNGYNTYVANNMWGANAGTTQTVCAANPGDWTVVAKAGPGDYSGVQTYPNVQQLFNNWTGSGWNQGPSMSDTPISALHSLTSTYATRNPSTGIFEAAYDIWLSSAKGQQGNQKGQGQEVMIWVHNVNRGTGGATIDAHTTLSGVPTTLMNYGSELILSFDHNQPSGTVDLLAALKYLQSIGRVPPSAVIGQIDFGWEICSTARQALTFQVTHYTLHGS
jgi:hypothetical protein